MVFGNLVFTCRAFLISEPIIHLNANNCLNKDSLEKNWMSVMMLMQMVMNAWCLGSRIS